MSNPAIVLMTDPSRCSLGDVHYLLQALREMQQMGEHAVPQAFCDHPAAAKDFIAAYTQAYPRLMLEEGAIPTPDHLQSLIANGQIGALGQPRELAPFGGQVSFGAPRTAEQGSSSGFPIVVFTLGSSQVLIDAMQQSPAMKDNIRLIDIVTDGADSPPLSIAEAVAIGGLDGSGWGGEGLGGARPELDEVAGASVAARGDLVFDDDPLDLAGVEAAAVSRSEASGNYEGGAQEPATLEPATPEPATLESAPPDEPEPAVEPAASDEAYEASPSAEPVREQASAVETIRQDAAEPADMGESTAQSDEIQGESVADDNGNGEPRDAEPERAGEDVVDEDIDREGAGEDVAPKDVAREAAGEDVADADIEKGVLDGDDVYYPPVGHLIAGSDVLYPALDQATAQGVLQELVSVLLDDAIFDPDQAFEGLPSAPDDLSPARRFADEDATIRSSKHVVTIEDLYGTFDHENEDVFADSGAAHPSHDTDL